MVKVFGSELNRSLAHLSLSPPILQELHSDEIKLAGLQVPLGLNPSTSAEIKESVNEAFVFGFRIIMLACAGLSLASAATAWLTIRNDPARSKVVALGSRAADGST
jgi:hypothetical protein